MGGLGVGVVKLRQVDAGRDLDQNSQKRRRAEVVGEPLRRPWNRVVQTFANRETLAESHQLRGSAGFGHGWE